MSINAEYSERLLAHSPLSESYAPRAGTVAHEGQERVGSNAAAVHSYSQARERAPSEVNPWEFPGYGQYYHFVLPGHEGAPSIAKDKDAGPYSHVELEPSLTPQAETTSIQFDTRNPELLTQRVRAMSQASLPAHDISGKPDPGGDMPPPVHMLGEFTATAICGNDITSSCLYVVGLSTVAAGVFAPVALALIAFMLYLFRFVYGEVGSALPLNGGAYNALLNTTSKSTASVAACLTILSYVATGVVSATEAIHYAQNVYSDLPLLPCVIGLMGIFMLLNLMGISESAVVALVIFICHVTTLLMLTIACTVQFAKDGFDIIRDNYHSSEQPDFSSAFVFGFAAGALGISGFETSANFIEEQKPGVFPKTLRNMWISVSFFNPILALLAVAIVPLAVIKEDKTTLLAVMGRKSVGHWFEVWISLDAFLVLSGAILTSFVGVTGLCKRLAGDRCLPAFLLEANKWRGTNHNIIILFFIICASMVSILNGDVDSLAGVYSISFLSVMVLFAVGDGMLKYKRDIIPRDIRASWPTVFLAGALVTFALVGTVVNSPKDLQFFAIYFLATAIIFFVTFYRIRFFKLLLFFMRQLPCGGIRESMHGWIVRNMEEINKQSVAFFSNTDKLSILNKAILYIRDNELTHHVRIVHICGSEEDLPPRFFDHVAVLDLAYPKIRIDPVIIRGSFGPDAIDLVAREFGIPKNLMFIAAPGQQFASKLATLGGVRVITH